jgi:hypothetical protein
MVRIDSMVRGVVLLLFFMVSFVSFGFGLLLYFGEV